MRKDREYLPLLGVCGAFIFILSAPKLASVTGSCSHPTGTGLSTICFGVFITSVVGAIVLLFQALLLAHGGLSTLGANMVSMAIGGPIAGYAVYRLMKNTSVNIYITVFVVTAVADLVTYVITSFEAGTRIPSPDRWCYNLVYGILCDICNYPGPARDCRRMRACPCLQVYCPDKTRHSVKTERLFPGRDRESTDNPGTGFTQKEVKQ